MADNEAALVKRVRLELGDQPEPFRQTFRGTGDQDEFDLPWERISTASLKVFTTDLGLVNTDLVLGTDYTVDTDTGVLTLTEPLANGFLLTAEGEAYGLFDDDEVKQFVREAVLLHTNGADNIARYRDGMGFIRYERVAKTIDNLPEIEILPVALLATVNALWALSTDASTDIDVTTSEGTHVARTQRFPQLMQMIQAVTDRYNSICLQLNVGLYRIETSNLRRVSRTTNRLVPVYVEREYDDYEWPIRIVPPIDDRDADWDGPPSPAGNGYY